jgi:hypothetical protein
MNVSYRHIVSLVLLIALLPCLNAVPPGTGSQHIKFTGYEEIIAPPEPVENGWMSLTSKYTLHIPSLRMEGLEIYIEWIYYELQKPGGAFNMFGSGYIFDGEGQTIGSASFMNTGQYMSPPPIVEWMADGTMVGMIWSGPFAGMVITANGDLHAIIDVSINEAVLYENMQTGFFMVSDNAEPMLLQRR